jgi:uncharacterized protein
MEFIVVGAAKADFLLSEAGEDELNEAHWAYMDRFASRLVARGPVLSVSDTEDWMGSVHIIKTDDRLEAERFAYDEPYWCAGQYEHVQVTRFENVLQSTMWERQSDPSSPTTWLVRWVLPNERDIAISDIGEFRHDMSLVFAGFLVNDLGSRAIGFVAAIDAAPTHIQPKIERITDHLDLNVTPKLERWRRGGRTYA